MFKNKDTEREYKSRWYAEHSEQANERSRKWCMEHRERRREIARDWYWKHHKRNLEYQRQRRRDSPQVCRDSTWRWRLKNNFGMFPQQYVEMLSAQGGRCAICQRLPSGKKRLAVDHDHETGLVRGLLCDLCNLNLEWAEKYVVQWQTYLKGDLLMTMELPKMDDLDLDALLAEVPQAGYAEVLAAAEAKMEQILGPEPGAAPEAPKKRRGRPPKAKEEEVVIEALPGSMPWDNPEHREAAASLLGYESAAQRDAILDGQKFPEEKPNNAIAPPPDSGKAYIASLADSDPWLALLAGVQDQMYALEKAILLLVTTIDRTGKTPPPEPPPPSPPEPPRASQDGAISSGPGGVQRFKETAPGVFLPA